MTNNPLFEPCAIGDMTLSNRIAMAPRTRNRAGRLRLTEVSGV